MTIANRIARRLASLVAASCFLLTSTAYAQTVVYYHTDALGSVVAVTDASRNVIEENEYEPYGKVVNHALQDGPGYTGHVADAQTGLIYMQQRYYDDDLGEFPTVDPVSAGSVGGVFNRYAYANNNPYRYYDPDGRKPEDGTGPAPSNNGQPECDSDCRKRKKAERDRAQKSDMVINRAPPSNSGGVRVDWKGVGRAFEGKIGPAAALQVGVKVGPVKIKVGPKASIGFGANLAGEINWYSEVDGNLVTAAIGKHNVGLGVLDGSKDTFFRPGNGIGTDITYYTERTVGYSYRASTQSNWAIGGEAGIPGGAVQFSIDFKQIWDSVNYED